MLETRAIVRFFNIAQTRTQARKHIASSFSLHVITPISNSVVEVLELIRLPKSAFKSKIKAADLISILEAV